MLYGLNNINYKYSFVLVSVETFSIVSSFLSRVLRRRNRVSTNLNIQRATWLARTVVRVPWC